VQLITVQVGNTVADNKVTNERAVTGYGNGFYSDAERRAIDEIIFQKLGVPIYRGVRCVNVWKIRKIFFKNNSLSKWPMKTGGGT